MNLEGHSAEARQNWSFLAQVVELTSTQEFGGWNAVVLYYSALHLVDSFLHVNGRDHGQSHAQRQAALVELVKARRLSQASLDAYAYLTSRSRSFRYGGICVSHSEYQELVTRDFRRLELEIAERLRQPKFDRLPFER